MKNSIPRSPLDVEGQGVSLSKRHATFEVSVTSRGAFFFSGR